MAKFIGSVRYFASWILWPALLLSGIAATAYGFSRGAPLIAFNLAYFLILGALLVLERVMPHERAWLENDGQLLPDIAHTLVSKGSVQSIVATSGLIGLTQYITPLDQPGYGVWPREWPLWGQVILGMVAAEFGLYWAHRLSHTHWALWRFHAVHHSVTRLWVVNTGRFHFVNSLLSIAFGMGILLALGAPLEVITWLSAITAFIGLLTHCNVEMRFGLLSYIFNTPELHRWHHSKDLREGDKNFSENIMLWDLVFKTWFNEPRRPPVGIGIKAPMPSRFSDQLVWPFLSYARQTSAPSELDIEVMKPAYPYSSSYSKT